MENLNTPYSIGSHYDKTVEIVDCNGFHCFDAFKIDADEILKRINQKDPCIINAEMTKQLEDITGRTAEKASRKKHVTLVFEYENDSELEQIREAAGQENCRAWSMDHEILRVELMNEALDSGDTGKAHVLGSVDGIANNKNGRK